MWLQYNVPSVNFKILFGAATFTIFRVINSCRFYAKVCSAVSVSNSQNQHILVTVLPIFMRWYLKGQSLMSISVGSLNYTLWRLSFYWCIGKDWQSFLVLIVQKNSNFLRSHCWNSCFIWGFKRPRWVLINRSGCRSFVWPVFQLSNFL